MGVEWSIYGRFAASAHPPRLQRGKVEAASSTDRRFSSDCWHPPADTQIHPPKRVGCSLHAAAVDGWGK